jgi:peptidoglycan/xylan/chitin deacetylase (PgdA/CDA1 family)
VLVDVAVCVRAGSPTTSACLDALKNGGVQPLIFTAPRGQGLALARNQALAATRAEVLAFVDDDIAVAPAWIEALRRAWRDAPEDRGWLGGPITATFTGPRPRWLMDPLLGVLGVATGGDTFHGGNVSFRAEALRGIGGFWPARGRPDLHDWFSEEHHAQHELAAAGWTGACEPEAKVARILQSDRLGRRDVIARRARYGARSALMGERRPRGIAARAAATSAAGAALAAVALDDARATERAARAAENVGVLLAPLIAHRDLQPNARRTPFLHSVAPPQPVIARRHLGRSPTGALIFLYHRVDDEPGSVSPQNFAAQIALLLNRRTPASLQAIAGREAPPDAFAVTFDDGYAETMRLALPVLEDAGVPATVFVATGHVTTQRGFWWDEICHLLRQAGDRQLRLTVDGETRAWARASSAEHHLVSWLQPKAPEIVDEALGRLRALVGPAAPAPVAGRPLSLRELGEVSSSPLIDIGAHTRTHANLRYVDPTRLADEVAGSRDDLEQWLEIESPRGLAYPFGVPGADVDHVTRAAAQSAGFEYAVLNTARSVTAETDRYGLPRLAVGNAGADELASLISRADRSPAW